MMEEVKEYHEDYWKYLFEISMEIMYLQMIEFRSACVTAFEI
jgi:hypothetical protein